MCAVALDAIVCQAWGMEADHPRHADLLIQSIPNCRLRGSIGPSQMTIGGKIRTPQLNQQSPPVVPGMQIHVNPARCTYKIIDPLDGDEDAQKRLEEYFLVATGTKQKIKPVPAQSGELDKHRMKTLCRELLRIVEAGEGKVCKGGKPTLESIDALEGDYLWEPGSMVQTGRPKFEKDVDAWRNSLNRVG
jgi:hypothetical protein